MPDDEREALLTALASMHAIAGSLYTVEGVRYVDPAIGWTPVVLEGQLALRCTTTRSAEIIFFPNGLWFILSIRRGEIRERPRGHGEDDHGR